MNRDNIFALRVTLWSCAGFFVLVFVVPAVKGVLSDGPTTSIAADGASVESSAARPQKEQLAPAASQRVRPLVAEQQEDGAGSLNAASEPIGTEEPVPESRKSEAEQMASSAREILQESDQQTVGVVSEASQASRVEAASRVDTPSLGSGKSPDGGAAQTIRMFQPFPGGRIDWQDFELPVVPASRKNISAYRRRMASFFMEFDRAENCRTKSQRIEQAGRFIIECDRVMGFDGVVVPDDYVEWTKIFSRIIQIYAESMYFEAGLPEMDFWNKHDLNGLMEKSNVLLERLTK